MQPRKGGAAEVEANSGPSSCVYISLCPYEKRPARAHLQCGLVICLNWVFQDRLSEP